MEKIHFTTTITAPKEKVWDIMLADQTYREWTAPFHEGSYYEGSWEQGSDIRFLSPDGNGMVARIAEARPYEFISIEHLGMVNQGVVDTTSEEVRAWAGAREEYTFTEEDGVTTLQIDLDTSEEYKEMFSDMWPKALAELKRIVEAV